MKARKPISLSQYHRLEGAGTLTSADRHTAENVLRTLRAQFSESIRSIKQRCAEGAAFRERITELTPQQIAAHLAGSAVDEWWLIGFHGDPALFDQQIEKARADQSRRMGQRGGKAPRADRYAQKKRDILASWHKRTNRAESAISWAERLYAQHSITVKPRTAAGWIRAAYPKKLTRKQRT